MDAVTRSNYRESMKLIVDKMIGRPHVVRTPNATELLALADAVDAMEEWQRQAPRLNFKRHIAIIGYHVKKPSAILFKDCNTMAALKAGAQAIEHKIGERMIFEEV